MEATTAASTATAARTIADVVPRSVVDFADHCAVRFKRDGEWHDVSYAQLGSIVEEVALGLIDLGVQPGERVSILANTRPEWSYADMAATEAGAVVVPIYQTNSPEECLWVLVDSEASAIVCENELQLAKIAAIRDQLPLLRTVVVMDPPAAGEEQGSGGSTVNWAERTNGAGGGGADASSTSGGTSGADTSGATGGANSAHAALGAITLDEVRERGRTRSPGELQARREAVSPEDPYTFIYTSGTTGPPKGCVLSHGNYRAILDMLHEVRQIKEDEVTYLYLPLAHSYALLIQLASFDMGTTIAYFGGDTKQIVGELMEVRPTYLPSVPRVFEKVYTMAHGAIEAQPPEERARTQAAIELGVKVRELMARGEPVPEELRAPFEEADEKLFKNVRAIFGGQVRNATSGAAPIAREILEFFWACGVPVLEGYGMTETATAATISTVENHRFGTVGRALPGVQVQIAEDGEILIKGPNIFQGYHHHGEASFGTIVDGWMHTGDLGSLDEDGYLSITGRKKDIIITAGGKNLTPANLENDLKQCRWISQAVMHGDQRPFPVVLLTLDEEEMAGYARAHGLPEDIASLCCEPAVVEMIGAEVERVNSHYAQVEQVKKFAILDHDLSQETGELTPTLKVKRAVVAEKYAALLDSLYTR